MAQTKLTDIVFNTAFAQYFMTTLIGRSAVIQSGIATVDPVIAALCKEAGFGGKTINLPYWNAITGDDEVLKDGEALGVAPITADQDVAVILRRGKAWGAGDLAREIAGSDPMKDVADRLADYWVRRQQKTLFSQLDGVFGANALNDGADMILDISGETGDDALLTKNTLLFAAQLLGDQKENLTAVAMHSMAETVLSVENYGNLYKPADTPMALSSYNSRKIVMDDNCRYDPVTKIADIYLFGAGAVAMNTVPVMYPFEKDREKLKGIDYIITRLGWISHLRGIAWELDGSLVGATPSNAELADPANWVRKYERKAIRCVKLRCKLAA